MPEWTTSPSRHDSTSAGAMATAFRRFSVVNPGIGKLFWGIRKVRAKGSPSGLNQTSANFSPLYFKAAHCFEGSCSEKFTPHLPPLLQDPVASCLCHCNADLAKDKDSESARKWEGGSVNRVRNSRCPLSASFPLLSGGDAARGRSRQRRAAQFLEALPVLLPGG